VSLRSATHSSKQDWLLTKRKVSDMSGDFSLAARHRRNIGRLGLVLQNILISECDGDKMQDLDFAKAADARHEL